MEFIHNYVIIKIRGCFLCKLYRVEALNTDEQMVQRIRLMASDMKAAKIQILHDKPKRIRALLQDFFPMRDKKQSGPLIPTNKPLVVEGNSVTA